jgi:NADPH-dependent 2,4-dienoyl-CoA reductase/sulfur reductase-like enzyme
LQRAIPGGRNAITVDRQMNCNLPDVHAAADCAVTWHRVVKIFD